MTQATALGASYIVAARRTALGRPGGLHKCRRIESLTAPVVQAALQDAHLEAERGRRDHPRQYHRGRQPGAHRRPCRGLERQRAGADRRPPVRLRPRCDPARHARRGAGRGQCRRRRRRRVPIDGAMAAWRGPGACSRRRGSWASSRRTAAAPRRRTRSWPPRSWRGGSASRAHRQDSYALHSHLKAEQAASERRFVGEIVPLRHGRRGSARRRRRTCRISRTSRRWRRCCRPTARIPAATPACCYDAAAVVVIVSAQVYAELGAPRALKLVASSMQGVGADEEARAPVMALEKLLQRAMADFRASSSALVEMSETSAAQALALRDAFDLEGRAEPRRRRAGARPSAGGGERGERGAALHAHGQRPATADACSSAPVTQGAIGGLGVAALFEAV